MNADPSGRGSRSPVNKAAARPIDSPKGTCRLLSLRVNEAHGSARETSLPDECLVDQLFIRRQYKVEATLFDDKPHRNNAPRPAHNVWQSACLPYVTRGTMTSVYGRCQLQLAISQTAELVRFLQARGLIQLLPVVF